MNFFPAKKQPETMAPRTPMRRLAGTMDVSGGRNDTGASGRTIRYVFSDSSIGRDNHVIAGDAWDLTNFKRNPVFLWAHDSDQPPIGRVVEINASGGKLRGAVEYAERDVYPFADTIFQLTKGGFLNATSTGWMPVTWNVSKDRARPGGIDFTRVELLEISAVPVPALPTALVEARARGIISRSELKIMMTAITPRPARTRADRELVARRLAADARLDADTLLAEALIRALDHMPKGGQGTRLAVVAAEWFRLREKLALINENSAGRDELETELSQRDYHLRKMVGLA